MLNTNETYYVTAMLDSIHDDAERDAVKGLLGVMLPMMLQTLWEDPTVSREAFDRATEDVFKTLSVGVGIETEA